MFVVLVRCTCAVTLAASLSPANISEETLVNKDIVVMHEMGLGKDVILAKIEASTCQFDVSMDGLRAAKDAGLPNDVIAAMVRAMQLVETVPETAQLNPNDPDSPHASGIYIHKKTDDGPQMIKLEPSVYSQTKMGGLFKTAVTYGAAKAKTRAVLRGANAQLQIDDKQPEFYFYFSSTNQDLDSAGIPFLFGATSANEFVLVRMEHGKKKKDRDTRQLTVGKFSVWGAKGGVMDESIVPFEFELIRPGVYRVVSKEALVRGEYCFFHAGTTPVATGYAGPLGGGKVFDFGVR